MRGDETVVEVVVMRWTLRMVADVEAMVVHLRSVAAVSLAPVAIPALACNISQWMTC